MIQQVLTKASKEDIDVEQTEEMIERPCRPGPTARTAAAR